MDEGTSAFYTKLMSPERILLRAAEHLVQRSCFGQFDSLFGWADYEDYLAYWTIRITLATRPVFS